MPVKEENMVPPEDPDVKYDKLCLSSSKASIFISGFFAGIIIVFMFFLALVLVFAIGGLLQLGMMGTGYVQAKNIVKSQSFTEILSSLWGLCAVFLPAYAVLGFFGVIAAGLRQSCLRIGRKVSLLGGLFEFSYDQLMFFTVFLMAFTGYGLYNLNGGSIVFDTMVSARDQYSFWTVGVTYLFLSMLLSGIFHLLWLTSFRIILAGVLSHK